LRVRLKDQRRFDRANAAGWAVQTTLSAPVNKVATNASLGGSHPTGNCSGLRRAKPSDWLTDLTLSCAAGPACRSRNGAAVAANDVRSTESPTATAVTPSRLREAGSSAAGPKPGRTSFIVKLGRRAVLLHGFVRSRSAYNARGAHNRRTAGRHDSGEHGYRSAKAS
jgi:hypothetical protein